MHAKVEAEMKVLIKSRLKCLDREIGTPINIWY